MDRIIQMRAPMQKKSSLKNNPTPDSLIIMYKPIFQYSNYTRIIHHLLSQQCTEMAAEGLSSLRPSPCFMRKGLVTVLNTPVPCCHSSHAQVIDHSSPWFPDDSFVLVTSKSWKRSTLCFWSNSLWTPSFWDIFSSAAWNTEQAVNSGFKNSGFKSSFLWEVGNGR